MEYIGPFLTWVNANQGAITALATVVLTATTMIYAWHTAVLAKENKLLRKAGSEPEVIAYLNPHPRFTGGLIFMLANVGHGPALGVSFQITEGGGDFDSHDARLRAPSIPLTVIPQGERYDSFFGMGWQAFKEPRLKPFMVEVKYHDLSKRKYVRSYVIDIGQFEGRITLGDEPSEEIAKALKEISEEMRGWTRRHLPVETISQNERERRDQARLDEFRARGG